MGFTPQSVEKLNDCWQDQGYVMEGKVAELEAVKEEVCGFNSSHTHGHAIKQLC